MLELPARPAQDVDLGKRAVEQSLLLSDVEAGRRTEIDVINGAVVREAGLRGLEAPLNAAMVALIKGVEAAREDVAR